MDQRADPLPVIVCLKWGQGYPVIHTNTLFRALSHYMTRPFRMVCLTDDPAGLADGIEALPLPDFALERQHWVPGMWPKLSVFKEGVFAPGTPVLLMDVDMMVLGCLGPMIDRVRDTGGLHIIRDWPDTLERWFPRLSRVERLSNSSVVGFVAGEQGHVFEAFHDADFDALKPHRNDQVFIHRHAKNLHHWPEGWMHSFKKGLAWHFPANLLRPIRQPGGYLIAFHGKPELPDLAGPALRRWGSAEKFGFFPVDWIKTYWERFSTLGAPPEPAMVRVREGQPPQKTDDMI
ncbi:hypothetical protein [Oceanibium sediminis]|uniref:hypothetical protein n=1 Tax=Oceanibium sediminis TaxID=2026339 RepID=UPI0018E580C4|nr:hypothetical protein [Oceanibium sediminis]